jgi:hypothetical protein
LQSEVDDDDRNCLSFQAQEKARTEAQARLCRNPHPARTKYNLDRVDALRLSYNDTVTVTALL